MNARSDAHTLSPLVPVLVAAFLLLILSPAHGAGWAGSGSHPDRGPTDRQPGTGAADEPASLRRRTDDWAGDPCERGPSNVAVLWSDGRPVEGMSLTLTNSACKPLAVEEGTGGRAICVYSAWGPGTAISVIYRGKQVANTVIEVDGRGDLAIVLPFGDKIDLINAVNGRNSPAHAPVPAPGWLQSLTDALLGYVLHIAMHRWAEVLLVALAGFFAWLIREKTRRKAADKRARARRAAA